jgi:uncharacterized protein (DUF58 family)
MYRSRVIGPLHRYFWRFKLTPAGRGTVIALLLAAIGSITVEIPIYQIFCALMALLFVTEPLGILMRPTVDLHGRLPARARCGEPFTGTITVTNNSRKPVFDLMLGMFDLPREVTLADADRYVASLGRGATVNFPITLTASRRGVYRLPPVHAHSTFPFNLMRFGGSKLPAQSLTVLPAYHAVDRIEIPHSQRYQPGGVLASANLGASMEYVGNREYVPGEAARRMDFRAWARLGKPVVREYQEEYSCRIALILDTHVPVPRKPGPEGFENLEAAISLTASTAEALSTGDFLIDLFAAGPNLHVLRTDGSRASFDAVLDILASVDPSRADPMEKLSPVVDEELQTVSTAVCVLLDWNEPRRQLADRILEAGCALKVLIVREGETTLPLEAPGGEIARYTPAQIRQGRIRHL